MKYPCLVSGLILLLIFSSCCSVEESQPIKRQDLADYHKVEISYHELAYYIQTANAKSDTNIESFMQLTNVLKQMFPDLEVVPQGKNPFPTVLVKHDYKWLASWKGSAAYENVPLVWTDVKLEDPEVLFLTTHGEILHKKTQDFKSLLNDLSKHWIQLDEVSNVGQ